MKYIIMEIHPSCAIAMDEAGRIVKVANLRYHKGQVVQNPLILDDAGAWAAWERNRRRRTHWRRLALSAAAVLCICLLSWHFLLTPFQYMTVYANGKGEVELALNRIGRVIDVRALDSEGQGLLDGGSYFFRSPSTVTDSIRNKAAASGVVSSRDQVTVSAPCLLDDDGWDGWEDWEDREDDRDDDDDWDEDDWDEDDREDRDDLDGGDRDREKNRNRAGQDDSHDRHDEDEDEEEDDH